MNEILNMSMNEMAEADFDCSCGRHHRVGVSRPASGAEHMLSHYGE